MLVICNIFLIVLQAELLVCSRGWAYSAWLRSYFGWSKCFWHFFSQFQSKARQLHPKELLKLIKSHPEITWRLKNRAWQKCPLAYLCIYFRFFPGVYYLLVFMTCQVDVSKVERKSWSTKEWLYLQDSKGRCRREVWKTITDLTLIFHKQGGNTEKDYFL